MRHIKYEDTLKIKQNAVQSLVNKTLKNKIRISPFTSIGCEYGVTDNGVRKWCKKFDLPYRASDIKRYTDEEWDKL